MSFPQVGDQFGPFRITGQIGRGGMGVVFAAEQAGLGRTVALKVLAPAYAAEADYRERFVREAAVLARLDSPHVIHIYDHGERDGCLFIATQYVAGGDLGAAIRRAGPCPVPEAAEIVAQMASALDDAHRAGIVHRDVKPNNVLLRDIAVETYAYLSDFGIAQASEQSLTRAGSIAGTLGYMAPERCRGEAATPASDIYALGCVLWTSLVGTAPYAGTDVEVGMAHLAEPIPQLVERDPVSSAVNRVLLRAMAKDPAQRHARAADLREELRAVAATARHVGPVPIQPLRGQHAVAPATPQVVSPPSGWSEAAVPRGSSLPSHPSSSSSAARPLPLVGQGTGLGPPGPPARARRVDTWVWAVAGILAVALVLGAVALVKGLGGGRADPGPVALGGSPSTSTSSSPTPTPTPTPSPTPSPTLTDTPSSPTPAPPKPTATPTYPDVPPATGPVVQTAQVRLRAPAGWGTIDPGRLTNGAVGAREYSATDSYYPTVTVQRSKPIFPLTSIGLLESVAKSREGAGSGGKGFTNTGVKLLKRAWLNGERAAHVGSVYDNTDGSSFFTETYYAQHGAWLYRLWFFDSSRLSAAQRRAVIDPVIVSLRWR